MVYKILPHTLPLTTRSRCKRTYPQALLVPPAYLLQLRGIKITMYMKKSSAIAFLYALPFVAFAQSSSGNLAPIKNLVVSVGQILNMLVPVLIAAALVVFFWGLVMYIWSGGKNSAQGRKVMLAGLVSLFVMVSVWGIVRLAQNALNIGPDQIGTTPFVPMQPGSNSGSSGGGGGFF